MATAAASTSAAVPTPEKMDPAAAVLSLLVPGLGQIVQGRFGKGLLFFVGIYGLFFYGQALGQWQNVFFGDTVTDAQKSWSLPRVLINLYNRPQYAGQFWVGLAAWPSLYHYYYDAPTDSLEHQAMIEHPEKLTWLQRTQFALPERSMNELQRDSDKRWDLGWVYTVIAGVLNILVIYDALAGPAFVRLDKKGERQ